MPLKDFLKYALYGVAAALAAYIGYVVLVERKGKELGQSVSGFLGNIGEGVHQVGYGTGAGIYSFMALTAAGIRSWTSMVTDMLDWFRRFAGGGTATSGTVAYVPPGTATSVYHQALYPTTFNFRTIQAIREGR